MATLVAPLASGVNGAVSGTAEFYRRGSSTPIGVYSDSAGTLPLTWPVALDVNGGVVVYADESVLVRVRSALGLVVREFTIITDDIDIDVRSASFTGTLPSGSQGPYGQVDERTVLNRWYSSAGALDWKIRRAGVSFDETLAAAFTAVASTNMPLFNVRTYGAVGDGVSDDYGAFVGAYNAAVAFGGGIIFVPAGNYVLGSAFTMASQRVSMLGVGAAASIITSAIAVGTAVTLNASASTFSGLAIRDVQIVALVSGANVVPLQIVSTPGVLLQNVLIKNFALAVDIRSQCVLENCNFTVPTSATVGDYVLSLTTTAADSLVLGGTFTQARATNTGALHLAGANITVLGAKIDISAASGAAYGVDVDTGNNCTVTDCDIVSGLTAAAYGIRVNADVTFSETDNRFTTGGSGAVIFLATALTKATRVRRGSREGRYKTLAGLALAGTLTVDTDYEFNEVTCTGAGVALTIANAIPINAIHNGMRLTLRIINNTGGGMTLASTSGVNLKFNTNGAAAPELAGILNGQARSIEYVFVGTPATGQWWPVGWA